jgi:hypothetical protein
MKTGVRITLVLMFLAGWLSACASSVIQPTLVVQSTPTITMPEEAAIVFKDGTCEYSGPEVFPYGQLEYSWRVEESVKAQFGVITFSLAEGKTLQDFFDWDATGEMMPPGWVLNLAIDDMKEAGGSYQFSRDLTANGNFKGDPIYMACYRTDKPGAINILGPFVFSKIP